MGTTSHNTALFTDSALLSVPPIVASVTDPRQRQDNSRPPAKRSTLDLLPGSWTSHHSKVASLKSSKLTSLMSLQTWTTCYYDSATSPMPYTLSPANIYCTGFCDRTLAKTTQTAYVVRDIDFCHSPCCIMFFLFSYVFRPARTAKELGKTLMGSH
jgi:hypothetical protein